MKVSKDQVQEDLLQATKAAAVANVLKGKSSAKQQSAMLPKDETVESQLEKTKSVERPKKSKSVSNTSIAFTEEDIDCIQDVSIFFMKKKKGAKSTSASAIAKIGIRLAKKFIKDDPSLMLELYDEVKSLDQRFKS